MAFQSETFFLQRLYRNIYSLVYKSDNKIVPNIVVKKHINIKYFDREWNNLRKLIEIGEVPTAVTHQGLYIVMTKMPGKALIDLMMDGRVFKEKEIKSIIQQLILILIEVHKTGVVHRDIKPDNILWDEKVKKMYLIDFDQKLTKRYASPENLKRAGVYQQSNDVWGVGIICYQLLTRRYPWKTDQKVLTKNYRLIRKKCSPELRNFIGQLLKKNPNDRLKLKESLDHPWFKKS